MDLVLDYPAVFGATEVERYYMKVDGEEEDYGQMRFACGIVVHLRKRELMIGRFRDIQHPSWSTHQ